jgi:hypothetical protein
MEMSDREFKEKLNLCLTKELLTEQEEKMELEALEEKAAVLRDKLCAAEFEMRKHKPSNQERGITILKKVLPVGLFLGNVVLVLINYNNKKTE